MEKAQVKRYCENDKKETIHDAVEDALEIQYKCTVCGREEQVVKTFF
ncbi:hypothetical protein [Bacillus sp. SG-1]|nr:hypothetical protein [Bacillus sp. SG-1]EDL63798.1 hypothetical protein BSG1_09583 [Bacillus sp. SG-1]